mmetsp:Transcript_29278/g.26757  ORF Transcript_29278/g.26757 Transcript_29278/m.26757 type:complete len:121 (+) Transcript_29278:608-970(+)
MDPLNIAGSLRIRSNVNAYVAPTIQFQNGTTLQLTIQGYAFVDPATNVVSYFVGQENYKHYSEPLTPNTIFTCYRQYEVSDPPCTIRSYIGAQNLIETKNFEEDECTPGIGDWYLLAAMR